MKKPNLMFPVLIFFFFLSGACGLMYEIIWQRMLLLIFGISNFAVATILSSFMAGLALGSYFFGKKADTIKRPLRLYAFLEIGIALFAFIFHFLLRSISYAKPKRKQKKHHMTMAEFFSISLISCSESAFSASGFSREYARK